MTGGHPPFLGRHRQDCVNRRLKPAKHFSSTRQTVLGDRSSVGSSADQRAGWRYGQKLNVAPDRSATR